MKNMPLSRRSNIVVQDLNDEVLIYDLQTNKALCLNETSGLVFQFCDGTKTVSEISDLMSVKLKTLVSEELVWLALRELEKENLLENSSELTNHFAGMSRREIIKRVGFASMIALPLISSVVAPNAVMAASGAAGGPIAPGATGCTMNNQCATNFCINGRCCVAGTGGVAPGPYLCSGNGTCPPVAMDCCSNAVITVPDPTQALCGGAGSQCVCAPF